MSTSASTPITRPSKDVACFEALAQALGCCRVRRLLSVWGHYPRGSRRKARSSSERRQRGAAKGLAHTGSSRGFFQRGADAGPALDGEGCCRSRRPSSCLTVSRSCRPPWAGWHRTPLRGCRALPMLLIAPIRAADRFEELRRRHAESPLEDAAERQSGPRDGLIERYSPTRKLNWSASAAALGIELSWNRRLEGRFQFGGCRSIREDDDWAARTWRLRLTSQAPKKAGAAHSSSVVAAKAIKLPPSRRIPRRGLGLRFFRCAAHPVISGRKESGSNVRTNWKHSYRIRSRFNRGWTLSSFATAWLSGSFL